MLFCLLHAFFRAQVRTVSSKKDFVYTFLDCYKHERDRMINHSL